MSYSFFLSFSQVVEQGPRIRSGWWEAMSIDM